jgi:hypothetical protein
MWQKKLNISIYGLMITSIEYFLNQVLLNLKGSSLPKKYNRIWTILPLDVVLVPEVEVAKVVDLVELVEDADSSISVVSSVVESAGLVLHHWVSLIKMQFELSFPPFLIWSVTSYFWSE